MNLSNTVTIHPTVTPHQTTSLSRPAQSTAANPATARQEAPSAKVDISAAAREAAASDQASATSAKTSSVSGIASPQGKPVAALAAGGPAQTERAATNESSSRTQQALSMFNDNAGNSIKQPTTLAVRLTA